MKKYSYSLIFIGFLLFNYLNAVEEDNYLEVEAKYNYDTNVSKETWDLLKPYFLPEDHPIKSKLDKIFRRSRVVSNQKSLEKAGFFIRRFKEDKNFAVVFHEKIPGYLLKIYTDEAENDEWINFHKRIVGAEIIKSAIEKHSYQRMFDVPKKWIYPLPAFPASSGPYTKHFILVVEKFEIFTGGQNYAKWKSDLIVPKQLDALYTLLKEEGLNDSIYPFNVPFGRNGKICFIDTEYYHNWPVYFKNMTPYLSDSNQKYWQKLITNGGP